MRRTQNSKENNTEMLGPNPKPTRSTAVIIGNVSVLGQLRRHLTCLDQIWMWISLLIIWRAQQRWIRTHRTHFSYPIWWQGPKVGLVPRLTTTFKKLISFQFTVLNWRFHKNNCCSVRHCLSWFFSLLFLPNHHLCSSTSTLQLSMVFEDRTPL